MDNEIILQCLRQTIVELRDEKYEFEKNGLAGAALDFIDALKKQLFIQHLLGSLLAKKHEKLQEDYDIIKKQFTKRGKIIENLSNRLQLPKACFDNE